jgi:hypothetical protein
MNHPQKKKVKLTMNHMWMFAWKHLNQKLKWFIISTWIYFDKLRSATFLNYVHFDFLRWDINIESLTTKTWQRTRSARKRINLRCLKVMYWMHLELFHLDLQPCNVLAVWKDNCFSSPLIYHKLLQMFKQLIKLFGPHVVHPKCILWCVQHHTSFNTFFDVPLANS